MINVKTMTDSLQFDILYLTISKARTSYKIFNIDLFSFISLDNFRYWIA